MPKKNQLTKKELVLFSQLQPVDRALFLVNKLNDLRGEVGEIDESLEKASEILMNFQLSLDKADEKIEETKDTITDKIIEGEIRLESKISAVDSQVEMTRAELDAKIADIRKEVASIDTTSGIKAIVEKMDLVRGKDGETPTDEHLLALIKPLIPKPVKGDKGDDGKVTDAHIQKIVKQVKALVSKDMGKIKVVSRFIELEDTPKDIPEDKYLGSNKSGEIVWKTAPKGSSTVVQGGGGASNFKQLKDTPNTYSGQANKTVTVKADESGLEFSAAGVGDMTAAVYDPASITEQLVGLTASQTLTNKSIDVDNNTITNAGNLDVARTAGSTYSTIQHIQDLFHSAGWTSGGVITSNGDGTCAVTAGTGLIRATDSDIDTIYFTDFAANASLALVNNDVNYIYVEYNAGSPQVVSTTTARTDYNTNFIIGEIYRDGTALHINQTVKSAVSDHAGKMIRFNQEVMPYAHVSGGAISETGTRNIAITAGAFWEGLIRFSTNSFDSSAAGTFVYYYRDGVGGWTAVSSSTQIDNTQYDNNTGTLATLTNNRYGVHWVYLGTDSHVYVVYGRGDYLLTQAQDAMPPSDLPDVISSHGFLVGKIIIQKNASTFTQIESAFMTMFIPSIASEHNSLSGLQGGTSDEYYHLTSAEYSALTIATPTTYTPSGTTQTITFADNDQLAILDLGSASGNVTLTLSGMTAGGAYTIKVIQGATPRNLVFPASVIASSSQTAWDTATQTLTMTATNDAVDVVGLTYDGTSTLMTAEFDLS